MKVHFEDSPTPPACFNREPGPASYTRIGIDQLSGERIEVEIRADWAKPGCQSWAPGIGQPTQEYPSGVPYPIAHGWTAWCKQCRHVPAEVVG